MSPCHVNGLMSVPAPSSKTALRWAYAVCFVSASPSSAIVNGPSLSASRTAARKSGQSDGASR